MAYTAEQYLDQLRKLLPPGAAWTREDGELSSLLLGLATEFSRVDEAANALMDEACPSETVLLLEEWETMCGLPDACSESYETMVQRRAAVLLKLTAQGGQSRAYFEELAAAYTGQVCTVNEYRPFRVGSSECGDAVYGDGWIFCWELNVPETVLREFEAGISTAGEPLRIWGNEQLECIINRLKPAHTTVIFTYGG